jgi:hypothetical protein
MNDSQIVAMTADIAVKSPYYDANQQVGSEDIKQFKNHESRVI